MSGPHVLCDTYDWTIEQFALHSLNFIPRLWLRVNPYGDWTGGSGLAGGRRILRILLIL